MARRHLLRPQTGAALLIFLVLLVMGALTYIVNNLTPEAIEAQRERATREALAQAREALIGYALRYRESQAAQTPPQPDRMYGYLPLPDLGSARNNNLNPTCLDSAGNPLEGCDANVFTGLVFDANGIGPSVVGRLPWRTLGIQPLRDGHGECLWLIVSSLHGRIQQAGATLPPMHWDTLGQLDIVVANGTNALNSMLASAHERPVAIIFSPGPPLPGQDRSNSATDSVIACQGNYNAANYLDPANAAPLGGITNYLGGANAASGITGDSSPVNDPDVPKPMSAGGKMFGLNGNFHASGCMDTNCTLLANDQGLAITADHLFGALRKNANFRLDVNSLLDRMVSCLRDQIIVSGNLANGKVADSPTACYSTTTHPRGYYPHWREMIFVTAPATVNGTACAGALLLASQRGTGQARVSTIDKAAPANYLEATNLTEYAAGTNNFMGPDLLNRVGPAQTIEQDIVRCIPSGPSFTAVTSPALVPLGFGQLVTYDPATSTLILGRENVTTGNGAPAGALFGCAWTPETHDLGSSFRGYFQFKFKKLGTSVGLNGFTFVLADALKNGLAACGAAGSHLGYSGNNGVTLPVTYPKIAVEFDQNRNAGFNEDPFNPGRNDPCGITSCGGTAGYSSHAAIMYWGHQAAGADGVTLPDNDDNVHGYPATLPAAHPPPVNPPGGSPGIAFIDMRGQTALGGDSHLFHVRIDVIPTRTLAPAAQDSSTSFVTKVWIVPSATVTPQVIEMQNTTSPVTSFAPTLQDTAVLYDVPETGSFCDVSTPCPTGQACGTGNVCYRQALHKMRVGFTNSQRTTDQEITISNIITTWLP